MAIIYPVTFLDFVYLVATVMREAAGEDFDHTPNGEAPGVAAVAWVILNRAKARYRSVSTVRGQCLMPWQFSCWNGKAYDPDHVVNDFGDAAGWLECAFVCARVLAGEIPDPTGGAMWYHTIAAPGINQPWPPSWAEGMTPSATIGRHVFYNRTR